eukprot:scaffold26323_cov101-Isochrysis_galbana.AAC.4
MASRRRVVVRGALLGLGHPHPVRRAPYAGDDSWPSHSLSLALAPHCSAPLRTAQRPHGHGHGRLCLYGWLYTCMLSCVPCWLYTYVFSSVRFT